MSVVDGGGCCGRGCPLRPGEACSCCDCPVCAARVPQWLLRLFSPHLASGAWIGPHCLACEITLIRHRLSETTVPPELDASPACMDNGGTLAALTGLENVGKLTHLGSAADVIELFARERRVVALSPTERAFLSRGDTYLQVQ